jgi:lipid-A-disaccharide synthase-like uncharacterized protein
LSFTITMILHHKFLITWIWINKTTSELSPHHFSKASLLAKRQTISNPPFLTNRIACMLISERKSYCISLINLPI